MKKQTTIGKWALMLMAMVSFNLSPMAQDAYTITGLASERRDAQDLSKLPKMDRDIIILQNVLNDLFNGTNRFYSSNRGAKGIYVPGKGVIFNIGSGSGDYDIILAEQLVASQNASGKAKQDDEQSAAKRNQEKESKLRALSKEFLVNYGSILSDLKAGEQVMLNVNYSALKEDDPKQTDHTDVHGGQAIITYRGGSRADKKRMVSSIDYATINSYLNGRTGLQAAESKVSQTVVDKDANAAQDAKIMAGILDDLFQSNFDGVFRRSGRTSWTYFEGFGLMYDLNLTGARGNVIWAQSPGVTVSGTRVRPSEEKDTKQSEAGKLIEENYDDFIELVKESLVTYGRTLRSVKSDEVVILNINFGSAFRKTKVPRAVRLQVTKDQIESFSRGQKSLEQLKKEIDITKLRASTSGFNGHLFPSDFPEAVLYETAPEAEHHPAEVTGAVKSVRKSN